MLEVPYWEAAENYLGAAPIRPADTVTVIMSGFIAVAWFQLPSSSI